MEPHAAIDIQRGPAATPAAIPPPRRRWITRMMLPMAIELARCLEEGIVETAAEADLALVYGVGFPPFRGGIFRWMDTVGLAHIAEMSEKFAHLSKAYELTERMKEMLANGETYY